MPRAILAMPSDIEPSLQTYLREIDEVQLLSADEEKQLARRIAKGDAGAREHMIRANLRLVVSIARRYTHKGLGLMDLIAEGNLGLLRAVERFDPESGFRFSTYATWWIKQAIRRALSSKVKTIHVPAHMVELITKWKQAASELTARLGREPTTEEVARAIPVAPKRVELIKRALRAYDASVASGEDMGWIFTHVLADERSPGPEKIAFENVEREKIARLLAAIDEREAEVLRLRYGLVDGNPRTLREIGERLGLTRERIRQIENEALRKLHEMIHDESEQPAARTGRGRRRS